MPRTRRSLAAAAKPLPVATSSKPVTRRSVAAAAVSPPPVVLELFPRARRACTVAAKVPPLVKKVTPRGRRAATASKPLPVVKASTRRSTAKLLPKIEVIDNEEGEKEEDEDDDEEEDDDYEAEAEEINEEDERMPSDVEFEEKPKAKRTRISIPQETPDKRKKISVAKGEIPGSHSRLKIIGDNKRFKFRTSACTNSKVTPFNVQEYLTSTRNSRDSFFATMSENGCIEELLNSEEVTFNSTVPDSENLTKWLDRSSIKFTFRTGYSPKKKHELTIKDLPPPTSKPDTSIPIFGSVSFEYALGRPKHDMNSLLVDAMIKSPNLISNTKVYETLDEISKAPESRNQKIQAFFCGGPILSVKPAPLCTSDGCQVVAVTTVGDEITWNHQPGIPSYIQFWKFSGLLTMENPAIWFLLRIENVGTISDMCWCPFFHEKVLLENSDNSKILGYLAVTTDVGKILIFKINKNIDLPSDNPPIVISIPLFVLEHPIVPVGKPQKVDFEDLFQSVIEDNNNTLPSTSELETSEITEPIESIATPKKTATRKSASKKIVENPTESEFGDEEDIEMENTEKLHEMEGKENEENETKPESTEVDSAPFICVDWSPFSKCKDIVAVSAAGWIFFYDLTKGTEANDALNDLSWDSQPSSAKWISCDTIAVGFTSKLIIFYNVNTKERLFEDNTARSVGTMVATQPVLFPGAFSYDSVRVIPENNLVQYQAGVYQTVNRETQTGLVVPLPNKHIGQVFNLHVCETTGIIGTVGCDGRLLESLNGRVTCRDVENDFACFAYRPTLQLIRHKIDKQHQTIKTDFELSLASTEMKEDPEAADTVCCEPIIAHDKVVSSNWLEIRVGDATLIDQEQGSKGWSSVYVEKTTFDRRMESLTRLEFSKLTPGLAITGGEAGIVFIVPTSL